MRLSPHALPTAEGIWHNTGVPLWMTARCFSAHALLGLRRRSCQCTTAVHGTACCGSRLRAEAIRQSAHACSIASVQEMEPFLEGLDAVADGRPAVEIVSEMRSKLNATAADCNPQVPSSAQSLSNAASRRHPYSTCAYSGAGARRKTRRDGQRTR